MHKLVSNFAVERSHPPDSEINILRANVNMPITPVEYNVDSVPFHWASLLRTKVDLIQRRCPLMLPCIEEGVLQS